MNDSKKEFYIIRNNDDNSENHETQAIIVGDVQRRVTALVDCGTPPDLIKVFKAFPVKFNIYTSLDENSSKHKNIEKEEK